MISYSEDQARAFVTDAGTLQRGQQLAQPAKWGNLGRTESSAWGECAGSGSKPYLTGIDLSEPAFKCSCPSRVFPCKHGAGLLLLLARQPPLFAANTPPAWLEEWLSKRQQAQGKKVDKVVMAVAKAAESASATPQPDSATDSSASPAAAAGPGGEVSAARLVRMTQGVDDLEVWLLDLVRNGLATLDQQPGKFWEDQAARLVDNQLPGLAGMVRELATLRHAHADWPARLLARLGELYWLVRAFQNREQLPPATGQEVLQQVGVTIKKEELPGYTAPVTDEWWVLGQFTWDEDRLTARRSWLRGQATGRYALVLEFAFGSQTFATPLVPQGRYTGALLFYPGPLPMRATPVALTYTNAAPAQAAPPARRPSQLLNDYADALARQPWLREWPATVAQVVPTRQPDGRWVLHHPEDGALPLRFADDTAAWQLLAESGGQPLTLFGEWDGRAFRPLSSWPTAAEAALSSHEPAGTFSSANETSAAESADVPLPSAAQLLRVALLGTRQSGENITDIPSISIPSDGPEQRLLLAAGTLALVQKAGFLAPPATTLPPAPAPPETAEPLGPLGAECFRTLLTSNRYSAFRTDYWTKLRQHRRLVPPALLVAALNHAELRSQLPDPPSAILGERGHWLAQQNPEWQPVLAKAQPSQDPATWETGTLAERRAFLQQLHQSDPEQARQLLTAALPAERAATQAALLGELEPNLTAADEPLLETYLGAKSKEVRQAVVHLLVRLPNSALVERLWQRATPLLTLKRPLIGRNKLEITLPEGWTKAWLTDGIEQKDDRFEGGERAGWLGQLLSLLPPSRWATHLQVSAEELLTLAQATDWSRLLLRAWARAAYLHQDKAFAAPLLLRHFAQVNLLYQPKAAHLTEVLSPEEKIALLTTDMVHKPLFHALSEEEKIALLRRMLPLKESPFVLLDMLNFIYAPWPADIVSAALHCIADGVAPIVTNSYGEPHQRLSSLLSRLAIQVPEALAAQCTTALRPVGDTHTLVAPLIEQFIDSLRFRQQLTASLTEPSTASLV
ncbi:hypothetical protein IC235_13780 [Hymenobacter sp. BT664]|uniref:SWIM-type domain-containing protein n=1 Tax=Hymenobacter montanus TaxID=2771359 RepID=A0A927GJX6_9BACT|nr:DUF5691 domain-containing protein [Hymenobacter montanus]MBD2768957.1 hypothetical protein [Hymenobacter montanus]